MEYEENLSLETENAGEQPAEESVVEAQAAAEEQPAKMYTEEEFNQRMDELLSKKLARREARIKKEYEEKLATYKQAEAVLNAGLGTNNIKDATDNLRNFYEKKGIKVPMPEANRLNDDDLKLLASNEAQKIIDAGFEDVVEEVDRLADKGVTNMTPREKLVFSQLANYRKAEQDKKELAQIGVSPKALEDPEFIEFAGDLNPNLSVKEKYERFLKYRPKPKVETMGSMKNTGDKDTWVKDFYTVEEARKFTKKDFDKNPALFAAVERSSHLWGK
jgi:hypothetical protein